MLDVPLHVLDTESLEQRFRKFQVGNLFLRIDVVLLANLALVQDRVEGVGCVAAVEVAAGVVARAVDPERLLALQEVDEFRDDLC